jgi:hypothetical protein
MIGPSTYLLLTNLPAFMPKTGRIVDGATGNGIPDIPVIAIGSSGGMNFFGGGNYHQLYRILTRTDANGTYRIPSTWRSAPYWSGLPGTRPQVNWAITAFKIGYAVVGDDDAWLSDDRGSFPLQPRSTEFSPKAIVGLLTVDVNPIAMRHIDLTDAQAANYYSDIIYAQGTLTFEYKMKPEEIALRRVAFDFFMPRLCGSDPEERVTWSPAAFLDDDLKYIHEIKRIESEAEKKSPGHGKDIAKLVKNECAALMAAEGQRQK